MIGIYKFTNLENGKVYIGQSVNILQRKRAHYSSAYYPKSNTYNTVFHKAIRKYGVEKFNFEILCTCAAEELNDLEKYYIQKYSSLVPNGYNMTTGGENPWGVHFRYNREDILAIIDELRFTTKSSKEIAAEWGCSDSLIKFISQGREYYIESESYPIRSAEDTRLITNLHQPTINPVAQLSIEEVQDIIYDLLNSDMTMQEIAQKYSICVDQISRINQGKSWKQVERPIPCRNTQADNQNKALMVAQLLQNTNLSINEIMQQVGYKDRHTISRINQHEIYKELLKDYLNPIRQ